MAEDKLDNPQGHNYYSDESTIVLLVYPNKSFIYIYFIYLAVFKDSSLNRGKLVKNRDYGRSSLDLKH